MDRLEVKVKSYEEMTLEEKNEFLLGQIDILQKLVNQKGIENQESLLVALMGNRNIKASGDSPPLFRFLQKVLDETKNLIPFISERGLEIDKQNEAKYDIVRRNILNFYHQDLRQSLKLKLKNYSVIQVQGSEPQTYHFSFGNGVRAEGSERKDNK